MSLPHARTVLLAVLLCSLAGAVWHAQWHGGPPIDISFFSVFACFGYASVAAHYLVTARTSRVRTVAASVMVVVAAGVFAVRLEGAWDLKATAVWILMALGIVGLGAHALDVGLTSTGPNRSARLASLRDALIVPSAVLSVPFFLWTNAHINPVYDARVYGFEQILGVPFSFLAMQSFELAGRLNLVPAACYLALPVGLSVLAAKQTSPSAMTRVFTAMVIAGASGFVLYAVCPVVGPVQAFSVPFPTPLPHLSAVDMVPFTVPGHVPRNGMPSLHTVWALLIIWNAAHLPWRWRLSLSLFAVLNVWAALGRYQHWFVDLVVAVPLAAALQMAFAADPLRPPPRRWTVVAVCAAVTLAWLVALRLGLLLDAPPWLAWVMVAATALAPLIAVQ